MPYISKTAQMELAGGYRRPATAGELNYVLTRTVAEYVETNGLNYQRLNDVVGALEGAKAEFQRRVVAPYEDKKIAENGDVYPKQLIGAQS